MFPHRVFPGMVCLAGAALAAQSPIQPPADLQALRALLPEGQTLDTVLPGLKRSAQFKTLGAFRARELAWAHQVLALPDTDHSDEAKVKATLAALPVLTKLDDADDLRLLGSLDPGFKALLDRWKKVKEAPAPQDLNAFLAAVKAWADPAQKAMDDLRPAMVKAGSFQSLLDRLYPKVMGSQARRQAALEQPPQKGADEAAVSREALVGLLEQHFFPDGARPRVESEPEEARWASAYVDDFKPLEASLSKIPEVLKTLPLPDLKLLGDSDEDEGLDPVALAFIREARFLLGQFFNPWVNENPLSKSPDRVADEAQALSWYRWAAALNHSPAQKKGDAFPYPLVVLDLLDPEWDGNRAWSFAANDPFSRKLLLELSEAQDAQSIREYLFQQRKHHARRWLTRPGTLTSYRLVVLTPKGKRPEISLGETPRNVLAVDQVKLVFQQLGSDVADAATKAELAAVKTERGQNNLLLALDGGDAQKLEGSDWDAYLLPRRVANLRSNLDLTARPVTPGESPEATRKDTAKSGAVSLQTITGSREWFSFTLGQSINEFTVKDKAVVPRQPGGRVFLGLNVLPINGDVLHDRDDFLGNLGLHVGGLVDQSVNRFTQTYFAGLSYRMPDLSTQYPGFAPVLKPLSAFIFTVGHVWERDAVDAQGHSAVRQDWRFMVGFNLNKGLSAFLKQ